MTATPLTGKFRGCIREAVELTSEDELVRIAELPDAPLSLQKVENARTLGEGTEPMEAWA